ncbi:MAG: hypothetical protein ACOWW1_06315 [archaeon]
MESGNVLSTAKKLGHSIGLTLGAEAFVELELSFITRLMPSFKNNPQIRARQHLLLYWDQSYLKSTIIREFSETLPYDLVENISSLTLETLFGSVTEDRQNIVKPALFEKKIFKIDELMSFLGTGLKLKDMVNTLNTGMEGGRISRRLIKLAIPDFGQSKVKKLKKQGIDFNPEFGVLSYQPDICVWAASRPIDNKTYTFLRYSGFLNRFHVLQHRISDSQALDLFTENFQVDQQSKQKLSSINQKISTISLKPIPTPPELMLNKIASRLQEIVIEETIINKRRLAQIIDIRTKGNILREISAYALLRSIEENEFRSPSKVEYCDEDLEFILSRLEHFVEFKLDPVFADDFSIRRKKKRPREQAKEITLEFLNGKQLTQKKDIDSQIYSKISIGGATIANALKDLILENKICQPKFGFYKLKEDCSKCSQKNTCKADGKEIA